MNLRIKLLFVSVLQLLPVIIFAYNNEQGSTLSDKTLQVSIESVYSKRYCSNLKYLVKKDLGDGISSHKVAPILMSTTTECERNLPIIENEELINKYQTTENLKDIGIKFHEVIRACLNSTEKDSSMISKYYYYLGRSHDGLKQALSQAQFIEGLITSIGSTQSFEAIQCDKIKFEDIKSKCLESCPVDSKIGKSFVAGYKSAYELFQDLKYRLDDRIIFLNKNHSQRMPEKDPKTILLKNQIELLKAEYPILFGDTFLNVMQSKEDIHQSSLIPSEETKLFEMKFEKAIISELQKTHQNISIKITNAERIQNCLSESSSGCEIDKIINYLKETPYFSPKITAENQEIASFTDYQNCLYERKIDKDEIRSLLAGLGRDAILTFASMGATSLFALGPRAALFVNASTDAYFASPSVKKAYSVCAAENHPEPQDQLYRCSGSQKFINKMTDHTTCLKSAFMASLDGLPVLPAMAKLAKKVDLPLSETKSNKIIEDNTHNYVLDGEDQLLKIERSSSSIENSEILEQNKKEFASVLARKFPNRPTQFLSDVGETVALSVEEEKVAKKLFGLFQKGESLPKLPTTLAEIKTNNALLGEAAEEIRALYQKEGYEIKAVPVHANFNRVRSGEKVKKLKDEISTIEEQIKLTTEEIENFKKQLARDPTNKNLLSRIDFKEQMQANRQALLKLKKGEKLKEEQLFEISRVDSIKLMVTGTSDPQKSKMLNSLKEKLGVQEIYINVNRDFFRGTTGGGYQFNTKKMQLDAAGQFLPRFFLKEPAVLHEINHAYYEASKLKHRDLPYYGIIKFSKPESSLVTLPGYQQMMSVDEISAYKKTIAWAKRNLEASVSPTENFKVFNATDYKTIEYLFRYRESARSTIRVIDQISQNINSFEFQKLIKFNINASNGNVSTAIIPILNEAKQEIGTFQIGLVKLSTDNENSAQQVLLNYLEQMRSEANKDFTIANTEIQKIK